MKRFLIGTDIGTSGTKTVLTNLSGTVLSESNRSYPLVQPHAAWAEQNALDWENAVFTTIRDCVDKAGISPTDVLSICVSGLFAGSGIPVDSDIHPIRNAIIWMDRRATKQELYVESQIDTDTLFNITGNRNDAYFGFNKMLWIRDNEPEIWEKTYKFLPSTSYIVYKLTGELCADYTSAANIGGIYDFRRHCWSNELLEKLGIPFNLMPERLSFPDEIVGTLSTEAAEQLHLIRGIPVCAGCTDCLASNLAAGVIEENQQSAIIGTSVNWSILHRKDEFSKELVSMPNVIDAKSMKYIYGGISTAGALTKWFLNDLAPYSGNSQKNTFEILDHEAAEVSPGSEGLMVLPYFMGERSPIWNSNARGVFCGLSLSHQQKHIYRAILESTAFAVKHIRKCSDIFKEAPAVCVVSGGAVSSDLWMQILADVTGLTIIRTENNVQAPLGDALIGGVAVHALSGWDEIKNWCKYKPVIYPDEKKHQIYDRLFLQYCELYASTKNIIAKNQDILKRI